MTSVEYILQRIHDAFALREQYRENRMNRSASITYCLQCDSIWLDDWNDECSNPDHSRLRYHHEDTSLHGAQLVLEFLIDATE